MELFQTLFGKIWEWLISPFKDLRSFNDLIFGKSDDSNLIYGIFSSKEINDIYTPGFNVFMALSAIAILIGILIYGMKISSTTINPSNRTAIIEFFKDLLIVGLVLFNLDTIYGVIFGANYSIIDFFSAENKKLIDIKDSLDTSNGVIGQLIIQLCLLGLSVWANFYYMMRRLTLLLFMIMGPLMVSFYLIPQTKGITVGWLKELIGTVLVQSVHAALYWTIAMMSMSTSSIEGVILYIIFIPVSESIRALLGLGGQMNDRFSKTAALFGGAALAGMYGSVKGALGGKSVTETLKGAYNGARDRLSQKKDSEDGSSKNTLLSNVGTDKGSTTRAERMLKAGEILSKGGKAIFGAAGAIAGSPMGPTGAITGSTIGFNSGGVIGGVAGRAGMALAEGGGRRLAAGIKAGVKKAKGIYNGESSADEQIANVIADDETTKWASENYETFMKDIKERFPDAHDSSLNKMWNQELGAKRREFLDKARKSVGEIKKNNGQYAKASELINSTVDHLANDWERDNKERFFKEFDKANPLPANPTKADISKRNQEREQAWNSTFEDTKRKIGEIVSNTAGKLGYYKPFDPANINKDDFANQVGNEVSSIISTSGEKAVLAVKKAVKAVNSSKNQDANAKELINSTIDHLTNDWAKNNKEQFFKDFEAANPLPANSSNADMTKWNQNREQAWNSAVDDKKRKITEAVSTAASKIGNYKLIGSPSINKDDFVNQMGNEVSSILGTSGAKAVTAVKNAVNAVKTSRNQGANAIELINSTVEHLTNDWANNNKSAFMKEYDLKNPLPSNASKSEVQQHQQKREAAWQSAVAVKKDAIQNIATKTAGKLGNAFSSELIYINKDDFANQVGNEISTVIGKGSREAVMAIKGATSTVRGASLYSRKSVNTELLSQQLASMRTSEGKEQFINQYTVSTGKSRQEALQQWNRVEAPQRFIQNMKEISQSMPRRISLDHAVIGNKAVKVAGAALGATSSFVTGTLGVKEIGQFIADTKLGQSAYGFASGLREGDKFDISQGVITGTTNWITSAVKSSGTKGVSYFKNHIPSNVIEKQAGFRNTVAYASGIIGGVGGYLKGASFARGGSSNITKEPGSLNFGFNPYNRLANNQISEVSEIEHLAQTVVGPNGQSMIANGAIRMVTTADKTVIQVRDKTGQVQTVSRFASGDSSLKKGQTIYQDLTIQDGQLTPVSNVYTHDSGGGKITLNRTINVDPNKIVGNRNTPKNPRVVHEVQSYNQQVDSGQYYLKQAMSEMSNIHMVIDWNRSYLVGTKGGKNYRISPYGPGDTRLNPEETVFRKYEVRNNDLILTSSHKGALDAPPADYYNSTKPTDLVPKYAPNKRTLNRKQNELFRNKAFTESLR